MIPGEHTLRLLIEPISQWLADEGVTDICFNRPGEVWIERLGEWERYQVEEMDFQTLDAIATLAAAMTNQDVGPEYPLCATTLPDGERVQICRPNSVSPGLISVSIRRPATWHPTISRLAEGGLFDRPEDSEQNELLATFMDEDQAALLTQAVRSRKNIIIGGRTGSGKTTLAKALIDAIPLDERIITIEDTPEWKDLKHQNRVALFYSKGDQGTARVRSEDLLEASLRMRPDRIMMQELRDGAAFTYLRGAASGHPGGITTCHARSASGAFDALRLMVRQSEDGRTLSDADTRELLHDLIDVVVHCDRQGAKFRVTEIYWKDGDHAT